MSHTPAQLIPRAIPTHQCPLPPFGFVVSAVLSLAMLAGCRTTPTEAPQGPSTGSEPMSQAIERQLRQEDLSGFARVTVEADGGEVRLSGSVASPELKARAADVTRQVTGVTRINNDLTIGESPH